MASTSHRNSIGTYEEEQKKHQRMRDYDFYGGQNVNFNTCLPGNGVINAKQHPSILSHNSVDIESNLLGIGASNLTQKIAAFVPKIKHLPSLSFHDQRKVQLPEKLHVPLNQRPFNI